MPNDKLNQIFRHSEKVTGISKKKLTANAHEKAMLELIKGQNLSVDEANKSHISTSADKLQNLIDHSTGDTHSSMTSQLIKRNLQKIKTEKMIDL